jgi:lysylphosphatidylglycerol synthetase-like protein (DUF2156 family)
MLLGLSSRSEARRKRKVKQITQRRSLEKYQGEWNKDGLLYPAALNFIQIFFQVVVFIENLLGPIR